jgi:predicted PurR-regulated permease PerM
MAEETRADRHVTDRAVETFIRIALIAILAAWCFNIVRPFIVPSLWGVIIAIGLDPAYRYLLDRLGGRSALAATLVSLLTLAVLLAPVILLSESVVWEAEGLFRGLDDGTLDVPPPPAWVDGLPLVGPDVNELWRDASHNLKDALLQVAPHIKAALGWLGGMAAGVGIGILQFVFAIGIAGVLLAHEEPTQRAAVSIARRLAGARGLELAELAAATVRSVTRGILGVALIQSLLAGLGWLAAGVPAAGLWTLLALLLSTAQVGVFLIAIPILIYVFSVADTTTFVALLIWTLFVGSIDNVLKPILLGRGVQVPMTVIFVGAIGGFLSSGIIGLFVGSVVLVLGYKLLAAWLEESPAAAYPADRG